VIPNVSIETSAGNYHRNIRNLSSAIVLELIIRAKDMDISRTFIVIKEES
jgi:hypothetical protein